MYQQDSDNGRKSGNYFMKFVLLLFFFAAVYFAYKYYHPDFRAIFGKSAATERIDNKRKLYDALSVYYDMDTFEQFSKDIEDSAKRRKLYDITSQKFDYDDYDTFSSKLGFAPSASSAVEAATTKSSSKESIEETSSTKAQKQEKVASSKSSGVTAVVAQTESPASSSSVAKTTVQATESTNVSAAEKTVVETSAQTVQKAEAASTDNGKHLTFKGVPINGTLSQFVAKMQSAGFKRANKNIRDADKGQVKLVGDFAGYNNCSVFVSTQSQLDLVCKIRVDFPGRDHWEDLYGDYTKLKGLLTEKYGSPKSVVEKTGSSYRDDSSDLMFGIRYDKNTYKTTFVNEAGTISISLTHDSYNDPYVCLEYFDAENMKAEKNLALSDL